MTEFKLGDVVRLKSGGPQMVITREPEKDFNYTSVAFSTKSGAHTMRLKAECFEHVKQPPPRDDRKDPFWGQMHQWLTEIGHEVGLIGTFNLSEVAPAVKRWKRDFELDWDDRDI